jgi:anaerobic selenocysteine-containing dehydrogenase
MIGLMGITGNLDAPGANALFVNPPTRTVAEFARHRDLSKEVIAKRLGGEQFKLGARVAFINPKKAWDSILLGEPYQLKAGLLCGTNPVVSRANAKEAYAALQKLEFLVVIDHFMTPTAELADIFLPAGTWLEQNHVADNWKRHGYVFARQKCTEIGEAWQDHKIFLELGKKMGQDWPDTVEDALDFLLEPSGLTWEQFKEKEYLQGENVYRKYKERGFSTPTRKLELSSTILEKWGRDPLPQYREIPESPYSTPEVAQKYPYIFNAGLRTPTFFHTANRMIPWLREIRPDPLAEIHPQTAQKHGIKDGQWIYIESPRGRIKQRAKLNEGLDPRVVAAEHGWWYPEIKDPGHGWDISNANILTDNAFETCDPNMGSTNLRVCLCNIYPCEDE